MSKVIDLEGKSPQQIADEIHEILWNDKIDQEDQQYEPYGRLITCLVRTGGWESSSIFC